MGLIDAIYKWLKDNLGKTTDTANSTGSLHAKIAELRTYINSLVSTRQKPRGTVASGNFSTNQTTYQTALNIAGKGKLVGLYATVCTGAYSSKVKVTIDGTFVCYGWAGGSETQTIFTCYPDKSFIFKNTEFLENDMVNMTQLYLDPMVDPRNAELAFKTSLKIELSNKFGQGAKCGWIYELE